MSSPRACGRAWRRCSRQAWSTRSAACTRPATRRSCARSRPSAIARSAGCSRSDLGGRGDRADLIATRRYAKRQRTWFRAEAGLEWIDADARDLALERILAALSRR
jgi:hypothetical protein